jgi:hypothetical protein
MGSVFTSRETIMQHDRVGKAMSAKIHYLTPKPEPIGHFLRLGSTGHRQLETLQSSGRLAVTRAVAEAASFKAQSELLGLLRNVGAEITLDTRIAELSEAGSHVRSGRDTRRCETLYFRRAGAYIFRPSIATSRSTRRVLFWR